MVARARVATASPDDSGVPWLDEDERAAWVSLLRLTVKLPARLDTRLGREAGLTLFEYTILAVLSEQPDATLRMSRLALLTDASASKLSHAARHLERRGLLLREPDPEDGRCIRAVLTDPGRVLVEAAAPGHVTSVRELFLDPLTPAQLRALRDASDRILVRIDHDGVTGPTRTTRSVTVHPAGADGP